MKAQFITLFVLLALGCKAQTYTLPTERDTLASKIKDLRGEHIRMPGLPLSYPAERYINVSADDLPAVMKGKIVLLDVWDYTCVNCIRTLPYIQSWHNKYKDMGLAIIGVHTPEFEFAKQRANVETEMQRFGLTYPVILDNNYEMWDALANKYWPAKYIFGTDNKLRAEHHGEGEYHEFEAFIQKLLLERDPTITLPELTPLLRATDVPGAVCYRTTPELYLGFERSRFGNENQVEMNKPKLYTAIEPHSPDSAHLEGMWEVKRQFAKPVGGDTSRLIVSYQAKEVNLVIRPESAQGFTVYVEQDFGPLPLSDHGTDIQQDTDGRTYIWVEQPRMYQIVNNKTFSRYTLQLSSNSPDFCAYAFTFTTDCVPQDEE